MTPSEIVATIRKARMTAGMTQEKAATAVGWKQPVWADYERGRKVPGLRTVVRMAEAVGLTVELTSEQEAK